MRNRKLKDGKIMGKSIFYNLRRRLQVLALKMTSDEFMSRFYFRIVMGHPLNLINPQTLNEKLQWLKLFYFPNDNLATTCSDKYSVREFVINNGMEEYLNDLYGVWDNADDIDWDSLPEKFVLKCTHGCGYNILCDDKSKLDVHSTAKQLNAWLREDFSLFNAEPHYRSIARKIICEKHLGNEIVDYKYFCFNGKVEFMYIANGFIDESKGVITMFGGDGKRVPYRRTDYPEFDGATLPVGFEKMKKLSEKISEHFPFVRVDWFEVDGRIYFSELTFSPCGAMMRIDPPEYDRKLGAMLDISKHKK